ncbi:MAG TPA: hypothetical protein VGL65_04340 [Gemmatimonadales bacterium]|jgi:hypothetical protein
MDSKLSRKIEAMGTALQFAADYPVDQPSIKTLLARLQSLYDASKALISQQYDGLTTQHAGTSNRTAARRAIRSQLVKHLNRLVKLASKDHPDLAATFNPPRWSDSNTAFVGAVKSILAAATAQKDTLTAIGIGETFFDDLSQQLAAFEDAGSRIESGKTSHVGAGSALRQQAQEGIFTIRALDGLYRKQFKDDAEVTAKWNSASHVKRHVPEPEEAPVAPAPNPAPPADGGGAA